MKSAKLSVIFLIIISTATLFLAGCKADEETKKKLSDLEKKASESQTKITALENDLKESISEINQLKSLVTKLGNVTVDLQRAQEEKDKAEREKAARQKAAASKHPTPKKASPVKKAAKKGH